MSQLSRRLRNLGVVKGTRHLKPARPKPRPTELPSEVDPPGDGASPTLKQVAPHGRVLANASGEFFVADRAYALTYAHGARPLGEILRFSLSEVEAYVRIGLDAVERLTGDSAPAAADFRQALFIDTETTGFPGAGTLAFMVGVGFFDGPAFVVRQYFLRDPGEEAAMLDDLSQLADRMRFLVSFNGVAFDGPLLDTRYLMNRRPNPMAELVHLDLLPAARRLWRSRLGSVALGALEPTLLGVRRSGVDIESRRIPLVYRDYLQIGATRELERVFYHNHMDILSLVTLGSMACELICRPAAWPHPADVVALAQWSLRLGDDEKAEQLLRDAVATDSLSLSEWRQATRDLALLLKRSGRRDEAVPLWQQLAVTAESDVSAHIELAKHYEWHAGDLAVALAWSERALALNQDAVGMRYHPEQDDLLHRLARLRRKQNRA